jgi:hypothetical protein
MSATARPYMDRGLAGDGAGEATRLPRAAGNGNAPPK